MRISRIALPAFFATAALALTGCVKIHTETAFSDHNTVDQTIVIAADPAVLAQVGAEPGDLTADSFEDRIPAEQADRVTVEDYVDGELQGVRIEARDLTLEELASAGDATSMAGGLLGGAAAPEVERQGDHYVVTIPAFEMPSGSVPGVDPSTVGRFINFQAVFSFPGPVVSSTHGDVNGKTVTLEFEDVQSGEDIVIRAVANEAIAWGPIITWGIIALAVLVIVGGGLALGIVEWRKRRPNLPPPESTDGTGIGVLPDATPSPES